METRSFQVLISVTLCLCLLGIIVSAYNLIRYKSLACMVKDKQAVDYSQKSFRMNFIILAIFIIGLISVSTVLLLNLNKSGSLSMDRGSSQPEIGTAKDLAELFD